MKTSSSYASLLRISGPYFTASLEVIGVEVVYGAPILRWMVGKDVREIFDYCNARGWSYEIVITPSKLPGQSRKVQPLLADSGSNRGTLGTHDQGSGRHR